MNKDIYRSKLFIFSVIFLFILLMSSDVLPGWNVSAQSDVDKLIQEGKELYKSGEYKEAILKFLIAKDLAQSSKEISEVHFNLSLAYYSNNQNVEAEESLRKSLEVEPERIIDTQYYPPGFVEMFNKVEAEFLKLKEVERKPEKPVVKTRRPVERKVKKAGGGGFIIVLVALAAGGVAAALLLGPKPAGEDGTLNGTPTTTGSIQVTSSPTGAQVYLDGSYTGLTTDCTLTNVSSGTHTVSLIREGYEDEQRSVSVTAGQTATVSVTLTKPSIAVLELTSGTVWTTGNEIEIKWQTSGSSGVSTGAGLDPLIHHGRNVLDPFQRRAFQNRHFQDSEARERGELENSGTTEKFVILSGKQSNLQGVSKKLSSSARTGDIFNRRAKDIRDIRSMSRVGIINAPVVPQISSGKFKPSGDIRALALSNVKIDLYKGGYFNQTIVSSTANDGSYMWTVDSSLSDGADYQIRISNPNDSTSYGESEEFEITTVSICEAVDNCDLAWSTGGDAGWFGQTDSSYYDGDAAQSGAVSDDQLSYVQTTVTGEGILKFYWKVSSESGFDYLTFYVDDVPVSGYQISGEVDWEQKTYSIGVGSHIIKWEYEKDSTISSGSDCGWLDKIEFITNAITITNPTSSTIWARGYPADITWTSEGTVGDVKIDLYKGGTFNQTIVSTTTNDGSYTWSQVDALLADGSDYSLRIIDSSDSSIYDESDEFTIRDRSITVTEPTSSTVWGQGNSVDIDWTSTGTISFVDIELYKGGTFNQTIVSSTANDGTYTWSQVDTSLTNGSDYSIRIMDSSDSSIYSESDEFTIEETSITVTEPTSSTVWNTGQLADIIWTSEGTVGDVKIDLYKGGTFNQTIVSTTTNDGSYTWTQVDTLLTNGSDYSIRITDSIDSSIYGESDEFTIEEVKSITVTVPTSSTIWARGYPADITWTSTGTISDVKIDLYKGTTFNQTIISSTSDDGSYTWAEVDLSLYNGSDYKVRISSASDSGLYGESETFEISHSYEFVTKWGSQGGEDGKFSSPKRLAVDSSGYVYVADTGNERIQKFTSDGTFVNKWGGPGSGDGEFSSPSGVAVDSSGYVYVSDTGNDRIQRFTSDGTYVSQWGSYGSGNGEFNGPEGIAVDSSGNVYVADTNNERIQKFTLSGTYVTQWGSYGSASGEFSGLLDVAVDDSGYVYTVEDSPGNRVQKFTSDGTFVTKWGSFGGGTDQFIWPEGIAADKDGFVYVSDEWDRIKKHEDGGAYVTSFGSSGSGDGQFNAPIGIAVDSSGNVYVADTGNYRIQKFQLVYSSGQGLNLNNPRIINNNFSTIRGSKTKSNKIIPPLTKRSKTTRNKKEKK